MEAVVLQCPTCATPFEGKYCAACGEKKVSAHDFAAGHFIEESIEGFTHFDNKFLRSIKLLLFRPGALTRHFAEGRKVPYMKPMQLFIVTNLLFFLIVGGTNLFSVQLRAFLARGGKGLFATRDLLLQKFGSVAAAEAQAGIFSEKMAGQSKAFIFLFIPFFALACGLLFLRRRKPIGLHLVFATHFFSFLLVAFTIFYLVVELPSRLLHIQWAPGVFDAFATTVNLLLLMGYFGVAARRFYRTSIGWAILSGIAAGFLFILLLKGYRLFLFHNILRTLH